jgi:hypothetical protein
VCAAPNSYTVLVQGALTCQPRFKPNNDGTLTDNQTGLMWQLQTKTCSGEVTCYINTYTWSAGDGSEDGTLFTTFLAALNADVSATGTSTCFANHCDWRIPNIAELQAIVVSGDCNPGTNTACIDPAFGPTYPFFTWSSSQSGLPGQSSGQAWAVNFGFTGVVDALEESQYAARAVRGGP